MGVFFGTKRSVTGSNPANDDVAALRGMLLWKSN